MYMYRERMYVVADPKLCTVNHYIDGRRADRAPASRRAPRAVGVAWRTAGAVGRCAEYRTLLGGAANCSQPHDQSDRSAKTAIVTSGGAQGASHINAIFPLAHVHMVY